MQHVLQQGDGVGTGLRIGEFDGEDIAATARCGQKVPVQRESNHFTAEHCRRAVERRIEGDGGRTVIADVEGQRTREAGFAGVGRIVANIGIEVARDRIRVAAGKAVVIDGRGDGAAGRLAVGNQVDRHGRSRAVAVIIDDCVGEAVGQLAVAASTRNRRVGEQAGVRIVSYGSLGGLGGDGDARDIRSIDAICAEHVVVERVDDDRIIFDCLVGAVVIRSRDVVDHCDVERGGVLRTVGVGCDDVKAVHQRVFTRDRMVERVVAEDIFVGNGGRDDIAVRIGRDIDGGNADRAVIAGDRERIGFAAAPDLGTAYRQDAQSVGAVDREAATLRERARIGRGAVGKIVFVDGQLRRDKVETIDGHDIVVAIDGDRQRGGAGVPVAIGDGVVEDLGQALGGVEALDERIGVVERVGIAAVRVEDEAAVCAVERAADRAGVAAELDRSDAGAVCALRIRASVAIGFGIGDDIAVGGQRAVFGDTIGVGKCTRDIVDDRDFQIARGSVAILVGDDDCEAVEGVVAAGIGGQLVGVANHAISDRGDGKRAEAASEGLADRGDCNAIDRDRGRTVGRVISEGAAGELAVAGSIRTGRKACFVDQRSLFACNRKVEHDRAVGDGDHEVGRRSVAVPIGDDVAEGIGNTALGTRIPGIGVSTVGCDGQSAVFTLDSVASRTRAISAGVGSDDGIVGTDNIVIEDVAADRTVFASRDAVGIVRSRGIVVDDGDDDRGLGGVAVAVGDDHGEGIAVGIRKRVVGQLVSIGIV